MSKKTNSYRIDSFKAKEAEIRRLKLRAKYREKEFLKLLDKLPLSGGLRILEIGSGTGYRAAMLAKRFRSSSVIGIDISPSMVSLAKKSFSSVKNLSFINEDLENYSQSSNNKFDLIYIRLVLQHVPDPMHVLQICRNLLNRGGYIVIEDIDRGLTSFAPRDAQWERYYFKAVKSQIANGGNPYIGRQIGSLLKSARFRNIDEASYFQFSDHNFFNVWTELFAPSFFNNLSESERGEALKVLERLRQENKAQPKLFAQPWFLYYAQK